MQWYAALHYSEKLRSGKYLSLLEMNGIQSLAIFLRRVAEGDLSDPVTLSHIPCSIDDPEIFVNSLNSLINAALEAPIVLAESDVKEETKPTDPVKNIKSGNFLADYYSEMKEPTSQESDFSEKAASEHLSDFFEKDEIVDEILNEEPKSIKRIFDKPIADIPKKKIKGGVFARLSKMSNKLKRR